MGLVQESGLRPADRSSFNFFPGLASGSQLSGNISNVDRTTESSSIPHGPRVQLRGERRGRKQTNPSDPFSQVGTSSEPGRLPTTFWFGLYAFCFWHKTWVWKSVLIAWLLIGGQTPPHPIPPCINQKCWQNKFMATSSIIMNA